MPNHRNINKSKYKETKINDMEAIMTWNHKQRSKKNQTETN